MASASLERALGCTFDYADIERIELPEIDCALLTTLLEESQADQDGGMGSQCPVPQSPAATAASGGLHGDGCEDCGLEDMLLDCQEYPSASTCMHPAEDYFCWADMDVVVPSSPSDDIGEWFMGAGEVGMVGYEDSEDYQLYPCYGGDMTVEDGYSPLWQ